MLLQRAGDEQACASALSTALAAVRDIDDDARALALARIARARAKTGDRQGCQETAAQALASIAPGPVDGARIHALDELAMAQAEAGDVAAAVALAERCPEDRDRARLLGGIAGLVSAAGEATRALAAARTIAGSGARTFPLIGLARTRGEAGDHAGAADLLVEAVETARQVADKFDRALWLVEICRVQVAIGDLPGATRSIVEAVSAARLAEDEDEGDRAHALCFIARNQPGLGNLVDARPLLDEASRAIRRIVDGSCRATARELSRDGGIDGLLGDICDGLYWGNAFSDAVATAREMECARARARTLVDIAGYQAREGDSDGAGETIVLALEAADAIAENSERAGALVEIARMELEGAA